jgi:hypothetical protein
MSDGSIDLRAMRRAVESVREVLPWFGTHPVTTADNSLLLARYGVRVFLEDLPQKYAAILSPVAFRGLRSLSLARHVPVLGRRLVLLHENGHLYMETAELGITYDNDAWESAAEQGADAFAAIGMVSTGRIDQVLGSVIWQRDVEDEIAGDLLDWAEGLWNESRALAAAKNRLLVRAKLGI